MEYQLQSALDSSRVIFELFDVKVPSGKELFFDFDMLGQSVNLAANEHTLMHTVKLHFTSSIPGSSKAEQLFEFRLIFDMISFLISLSVIRATR